MSRTVLFLCTGNYYRSRFAESLFNHLAPAAGLDWIAESAGVAIEMNHLLPGNISPHTLLGLHDRGIATGESRPPRVCTTRILQAAQLVIALKAAEHRPLLAARFPGWEDKVQYWNVHDLDQAGADSALAEIEVGVRALVARLAAGGRDG